MSRARVESACLRVAGALLVLIGAGHILMPTHGYLAAASAGMSEAAREHFYFLGTYAICSFLLAFGALSVAMSFAPGVWLTRVFSLLMAAVWLLRVALEFIYPVELQIFFLAHPHPVLVPVLLVVAMAYALASWLGSFGALRPQEGTS